MGRMLGDRPDDPERQFVQLYEQYAPAVMAYALRRTTPDAAQDIVADTFLVAWRRLAEIPADRVLPWLYGVAYKIQGNRRRSDARQRSLVKRIQAEASGPTSDGDVNSNVLAALASLPPHDREVLMLTAWEGLSTAEAALAIDCSPTAARVRLYRARRKLKVRLDQIEDADDIRQVSVRSWTKESL